MTVVPDSAQPWMDQDPVDPTWATPPEVDPTLPEPAAPTPESRDPIPEPVEGHHSKLLTIGVPILAVVLIIGLAVGLGGFKQRTDLLIDKSPGEVLTTGPYEFTFTKVTAQRKKDFDDTHYWEVIVLGQGRTTGDEAISPDYSGNDGMFVARDPNSPEVQSADITVFGNGGFTSASDFTPGLPPSSFKVEFKFSDKYEPGKTIRFGASVLEFTDNSLIGNDDKKWNNSDYFYHLHLPVEVLPEESF